MRESLISTGPLWLQAELLPSYAKTYILPRKKRKWSVSSEGGETEEEAGQERSRKGGLARKQSAVTPEFQMSMLRAALLFTIP